MEAKLKQKGEIAIVCISGPLVIEKTQFFRDICHQHDFGQKVIFNLERANFVGSTGIQSFVEALKIVSSKTDQGLKLVGLKTEFRRIFANVEIQGIEIYDTERNAIEAFLHPKAAELVEVVATAETLAVTGQEVPTMAALADFSPLEDSAASDSVLD